MSKHQLSIVIILLLTCIFSGCTGKENLISEEILENEINNFHELKNDCYDDSCIGIECYLPSFSSLDNNSDDALDVYEFVFGLSEFDNRYTLRFYENIFEEFGEELINESEYGLIHINDLKIVCIGLDCGFPKYEEIDSDASSFIEKAEFINELTLIDYRYVDSYTELFNETDMDGDGIINQSQYISLSEQYDYYEYGTEFNQINHSSEDILFSKTIPKCWHLKFFDGLNTEFGSWGGSVRYTDSNGIISTTENFNSYQTYVYLNESLSWTIEYEFRESDVGFILDNTTYGGDNDVDEDRDLTVSGTIYIDFEENNTKIIHEEKERISI